MKEAKNLVVQTNSLIEARYKQTFTVQELRTVAWLISEVHRKDRYETMKFVHQEIEIPIQKYANLIGVRVDNASRDAKKVADSLGSKRFTLNTGNGWINLGWISSMEYKQSEGIIRILVSPDLLPYILDMKDKDYTKFTLENILSLSSSHAIKLYQFLVLIKNKHSSQEKKITVDELRLMFGVSETKSYSEYKHFKQRILEIAEREINEKTDINFSYSEKKNGRKVESIIFKIIKKPELEQINI